MGIAFEVWEGIDLYLDIYRHFLYDQTRHVIVRRMWKVEKDKLLIVISRPNPVTAIKDKSIMFCTDHYEREFIDGSYKVDVIDNLSIMGEQINMRGEEIKGSMPWSKPMCPVLLGFPISKKHGMVETGDMGRISFFDPTRQVCNIILSGDY